METLASSLSYSNMPTVGECPLLEKYDALGIAGFTP